VPDRFTLGGRKGGGKKEKRTGARNNRQPLNLHPSTAEGHTATIKKAITHEAQKKWKEQLKEKRSKGKGEKALEGKLGKVSGSLLYWNIKEKKSAITQTLSQKEEGADGTKRREGAC